VVVAGIVMGAGAVREWQAGRILDGELHVMDWRGEPEHSIYGITTDCRVSLGYGGVRCVVSRAELLRVLSL